ESTAVVDASDAQPIRLLAASPRIQPHPPAWTQVDGLDTRVQFVDVHGRLDSTQRPRAAGGRRGEQPGLAARIGYIEQWPAVEVGQLNSSVGGEPNAGDPDRWSELRRFLMELRQLGLAVLMVQHAN